MKKRGRLFKLWNGPVVRLAFLVLMVIAAIQIGREVWTSNLDTVPAVGCTFALLTFITEYANFTLSKIDQGATDG